ncbi:FHIPEP family type III secretion protein [Celeribacter indicus]|uniref:FHIPEP family type III secretion protein n=1 Tax=Celeribacter indicus TaxID=1208324 RepID=UPI00139245D2|nr:FHIPEP family type III secretion protein [Celeribacter indicus]
MNHDQSRATANLRDHLRKTLRDRDAFHGKPTQRLAAQIAAQLIDQERQLPWALCQTIEQIDILRSRLPQQMCEPPNVVELLQSLPKTTKAALRVGLYRVVISRRFWLRR